MDARTIVHDSRFCGKYVALDSFIDAQVVADGDEPLQVCQKAREAGIAQPVILFVPDSGIASI